jgi:hypothetical protein
LIGPTSPSTASKGFTASGLVDGSSVGLFGVSGIDGSSGTEGVDGNCSFWTTGSESLVRSITWISSSPQLIIFSSTGTSVGEGSITSTISWSSHVVVPGSMIGSWTSPVD